MATIENILNKEKVYLHYQHTFGRGTGNTTQIKSKDVSTDHAKIYWQENQWYLKDRSRNGTVIKNRFVQNNQIKLSKGDTIRFGKDRATEWLVTELDQPRSYLKSLSVKNQIIPLQSHYVFPNEKNPDIEFYYTNRRWKAEKAGETFELHHRQTFEYKGRKWMFVENELEDTTVDNQHIKEHAHFIFTLSADQERINIQIVSENMKMNLGNRTYNHILLLLAQQCQKDIGNGLQHKDQGWMTVEELTQKLSREEMRQVDQYNLNTRIRRLRQDLLKLPPYGSQFVSVLERRKGQIRFNHPLIEILY